MCRKTTSLIYTKYNIFVMSETFQNEENISEEVLGLLRAASGKARLLATQKMQQFQGIYLEDSFYSVLSS